MLICTLGMSALALFGKAPAAPSWPIEPHTLTMLCEKSDLVVYARVNRLEVDSKFLSWFDEPRTTAVLDVIDIYHGEVGGQVRVEFEPNMICPQPAKYPRGEKVLAFLQRDEERSSYFTTGLSYGTKVLASDDARIYGQHIRRYFEICREAEAGGESNEKGYGQRLNDWWIDLCYDSVTRHEGASNLNGYLSPATPLVGEFPEVLVPVLTESQLKRVRDLVFPNLSRDGFEAGGLIGLLYRHGDPQIERRLLEHLKSVAANPESHSLWNVGLFMVGLAEWGCPADKRSEAAACHRRFLDAYDSSIRPTEEGEGDKERFEQECVEALRDFLGILSTEGQ